MFCQDDWARESVREYVHVELENYMNDHLLSDSVVLESWDGYRRSTQERATACKVGCPWPHEWRVTADDRTKYIRVDLRKFTSVDIRHVREGRKAAQKGLEILKSYLKN